MKRIKYLLLISLFALTSCTLKNEVYDKINPGIFPQTAEEAETLANTAYIPFSPRDFFGTAAGYITNSEIGTDLGESAWYWQTIYNNYEADCPHINNDGRRLYDRYFQISRMTLNIDRIQNVKMDEKLKARYQAELLCGRSFLAFLLYDVYGPIPFADLETLKNPLKSEVLPRPSEKEMQDFIENGLKQAAEVLPYSYPKDQYGRFTKGVANMVLLKLYMMVGRWADAEVVARELMKPEYGYKLEQDYNLLFSLAGERNPEIIYALNCKEGYAEHEWFAHILPKDFPQPAGVHATAWGGYKVSWPCYEKFDPKDHRRERLIGEYVGNSGIVHNKKNDRDSGTKGLLYNGAVPLKYKMEAIKGQKCFLDIPIYRYADVLLLLSEAIVRKGNAVTQEAVDLMNQVRTVHGGLEPYSMSDFPTVEVYYEKMLDERLFEFWWEGVRRQDLIRFGKFIEFAVLKNEYAGEPTEKVTTKEDGRYKYERLPIPIKYINEGQGIIKQNPGY